MMNLRRGDVVLVWFPHSDLKTFKQRPALVVQADGLETGLPEESSTFGGELGLQEGFLLSKQ